MGAIKYNSIPQYSNGLDSVICPKDWKVGAIEPTTGIHGDIDYLYTIDLITKEITYTRDFTGEEF